MVSGTLGEMKIRGTKNTFKEDTVNRYAEFRRGQLPGNILTRAKGQEANMAFAER